MTFASSNIPPASPLSYEGQVVIPYINKTFAPTSSNNQFQVPTIWVDTAASDGYILTSKPGGVADWQLFTGGSGAIIEIQADSGSATPVDGIVTISGGTTGLTTLASGSIVDLTGILSISNGGTGVDSGAVLLFPSSDQTITGGFSLIVDDTGNLQASQGNVLAGSDGFAGHFFSLPPTSASGYLEIAASDSAGEFQGLLTNASLSASRTWTLPDATGTIVLSPSTTVDGVVITDNSGNITVLANGTADQVLTANSGAPPSWQNISSTGAFTSIKIQTFSSSGTYTPTAGTVYSIVECIGGGAGGGSCSSTGASQVSAGGGGGAGGYSRKIIVAPTSVAITVGSGGAGGSSGGQNNGASGTSSSYGSVFSATGGSGGMGADAFGTSSQTGGVGGTGVGGDFNSTGESGFCSASGFISGISSFGTSGQGGSSVLGAGGMGQTTVGTVSDPGINASNYGSGGSGAICAQGGASAAGGDGSDGCVIVTEFID